MKAHIAVVFGLVQPRNRIPDISRGWLVINGVEYLTLWETSKYHKVSSAEEPLTKFESSVASIDRDGLLHAGPESVEMSC